MKGGGLPKVKTAVVSPQKASVTTTRDCNWKIRLNQIIKQTAKKINPDPPHQTDIKFAIYKILSDDFMLFFVTLIFWSWTAAFHFILL